MPSRALSGFLIMESVGTLTLSRRMVSRTVSSGFESGEVCAKLFIKTVKISTRKQ